MEPEVVAEDTGLGEGPVWCPDGTLVVTSVDRGVLYRIDVQTGSKELVADTAGSPNAAQLAADGGFIVTQAGGHDLSPYAPGAADRPPGAPVFYTEPGAPRFVEPGLQRVLPDGSVSYLVDRGFRAPNDLCVAADGTVYFTDPPVLNPPTNRDLLQGRVWAYRPDGSLEVVASDFYYCNGIALGVDGVPIVVERSGLQRVHLDGTKEWVVESMGEGAGDGFCLDTDGRIYAPFNPQRGVKVIEDGREVDFLPVPGGPPGVVTNCCFGGPDGRTLFVTDAFHGRVLAWEHMPAPGLPLVPWPGPAGAST